MSPTPDTAANDDAPRLPPELLYLLERLPRERWDTQAAHGTAGVWRAMHESLRHGQHQLQTLGQRWLDKDLDWVGFRRLALPLLDAHLGHLHGHHRLEDQHYFPAMRRAEPRLAAGFDLLARDHETIDAAVRQLHGLRHELTHVNPAEAAAWGCAHALVREASVCGTLLLRHLADEEDLVIPLLALREGGQHAA